MEYQQAPKNLFMTKSLIIPISLFFTILILLSCNENTFVENNDINAKWKVAYKNNKDGSTLQGSKEILINSIRQGASVRIGWGSKGKTHRIEHLSDPIWIAILDEKEVIAHLAPQVLSRIDWDSSFALYDQSDMLHQEWRVVINTDGKFDAIWYDRKENKQIKRVPQNHIITWFVDYRADPKIKVNAFFEID